MIPSNPAEASKEVFEVLSQAVAMLGFTKTPEVKLETEPHSDPMVRLDGFIYIAPVEAEVKAPLGGKPIQQIHYQIQVLVHDPGVYRYKDGSGQPPSDDLVDVGEPIKAPYEAVQRALELYWKSLLSHVLENISMAAWEKERHEEV